MNEQITITQDALTALVAQAVAQVLAGVTAETATPAVEAPAKPEKAYRSATAKAKARAAADKVWADAKAKAGVKRVKDLSAKEQARCKDEVRKIWAAAPKTRTTPAN